MRRRPSGAFRRRREAPFLAAELAEGALAAFARQHGEQVEQVGDALRRLAGVEMGDHLPPVLLREAERQRGGEQDAAEQHEEDAHRQRVRHHAHSSTGAAST